MLSRSFLADEEMLGAVGGPPDSIVKEDVEVETHGDAGKAAERQQRLRRRNCVRNRGVAGGVRRPGQGGGHNAEGGPGSPSIALEEAQAPGVFVEEPDFPTRGAEAADVDADTDAIEPELSELVHNHDDTSEGAVHYFQDENGE